MRKYFFILSSLLFLAGCKKSNTSTAGKVAFYWLASYTAIDGKCQVNPVTAVLETTPFISNSDIVSYSQSRYSYTITAAAKQAINEVPGRKPFAVTVNNTVVMYGYYNPPILSSSCEHSISLGAFTGEENKIDLRLGYPGIVSGTVIDDQRNNELLLNALKAQGKWRP